MCRDLREVCIRYEQARISEQATVECSQARQDRIEAEYDEARVEYEADMAEIRREKNHAAQQAERALMSLKEALAEQGCVIVCENWAYSLINGQINRQRWRMAAAVAGKTIESFESEPYDDADIDEWPEEVVVDAQSLGEGVVKHLQRTDMRGSFAGPKRNGKAEAMADDLMEDLASNFDVG